VRTLEQLFDGLLDISKIESGIVKPNTVAFPLMPLIEQVVAAERPLAAHKGLDLRVVHTAACVRSDPALLARMLKNLVTNAIRYTERGRIVVGCRRTPGGGFRLEVVDSGVGIPAHEHERIFDEYYRLPGSSAQGFGLGLAIVKGLGELLGHAVAVRSAVGRGSIFSIELERALDAPAPSPADLALSAHSQLSGVCVVLVDDDVEIRNSMRLLLESWGCRYVGGATAADVEDQIRAQGLEPDAVIADYLLADSMNGLHAIDQLRAAHGRHLPALIITGTPNAQLLRQRAAGGVPVAVKPVSPGVLRAFLSQGVRRRGVSAPA